MHHRITGVAAAALVAAVAGARDAGAPGPSNDRRVD